MRITSKQIIKKECWDKNSTYSSYTHTTLRIFIPQTNFRVNIKKNSIHKQYDYRRIKGQVDKIWESFWTGGVSK
jgi:hypothetical protein